MATLTEISYASRKMLPVFVILFLVIMIFYFAFQLLYIYLNPSTRVIQVTTPGQLPVNTAFGKIPAPKVKDALPSSGYTYVLDTIDAQPIEGTSAATIYFMPEVKSGFGYLSRIVTMAKASEINTDQIKERLNGRMATYSDGIRNLEINTNNFNFIYNYTITRQNTNFVAKAQANDVEAAATEYLRKMEHYPEELAQGKRHTIYMNYNPDNNGITIVPDESMANMAEVDFHRPDIEGFPVVTSKYFNSNSFVLVAYTDKGYKIVKAQVQYYPRSAEQTGVYPLKSGKEAFQELIDGKGMIVSGKPAAGSEIKLKQMSMGYLDTLEYQPYLQPVYILLGERDFVAYVSAVSNEYIGTN